VSTGDKKTTIALTPAGKNVLKGKGEFTLEQDSTVVVFVKMPDQEAWGAEFMPLKPKANAEMHDMDHEHHHDMDHEHHHDADNDHDADHDHDAEDEHHHHDND